MRIAEYFVQEKQLTAEIATIMHVSALGHWQPALQTLSSIPPGLWELVDSQLSSLLTPSGVPQRLDLITCLEILYGPGLIRDKIRYIQSAQWHFEVEDIFMAVAVTAASGRSRGIWRPMQHEFQTLDLDPTALAAISTDLVLRVASTYHNPETTPDSPDEVWRSTFRTLARREHSRPVAAVAQAVLKRTPCLPDVEKDMRRVLRLTEFHSDSLNSAWC